MPDPNVIVFPCRTLTPIWTGDISRNSAEVKESGILGSLRFWYEGILRSYGIRVCGTTGQDETCPCQVCELFGKTGQARKFRLTAQGLSELGLFFESTTREMAQTNGAYLYGTFTGGRMGDYRDGMDFQKKSLWAPDPDHPFKIEFRFRVGSPFLNYFALLAFTLKEAASKGGLGAKTQLGFGQIEILLPPQWLDPLAARGRALLEARRGQESYNDGEFSTGPDRFFSLRFEGTPPERYWVGHAATIGTQPPLEGRPFIPCAFDIRFRDLPLGEGNQYAGLRPQLSACFSPDEAREMLGYLNPRTKDASASRIHVSHLYRAQPNEDRYRLKIWGDVDKPAEVAEAITEYVDAAFGWNPV